MRRPLATVALTVAVVAAIACGGSGGPTTPTPASVAGTWNLQSVNGQGLPYILVQSGANKVEWTADQLLVGAGGTFTQTSTFRVTTNGQVATQTAGDAGTYTLTGTNVTFVFASDGSSGAGTLSGKTLTVSETGLSLVYEKQ